jgi:hypothetical protein
LVGRLKREGRERERRWRMEGGVQMRKQAGRIGYPSGLIYPDRNASGSVGSRGLAHESVEINSQVWTGGNSIRRVGYPDKTRSGRPSR